MTLLKQLIDIQSLSGNESSMRDFLIAWFEKNKRNFTQKPKLHYSKDMQDCLVVEFGKPRTAVFAHMDTVGFMVKYGKELIEIGGPETKDGYTLSGQDKKGDIECTLKAGKTLEYKYSRQLERGTELRFKPNLRLEGDYIISPHLDNRLGLWVSLKLAETLKDGLLVYTCNEEHYGGSALKMARFIYKKFKVTQALICDITWITKGVKHGKGVAISMRDSTIPRRKYFNHILSIAEKSKIPYQVEVEDTGGSDGSEIQRSAYPIDWCFVGAAESNVHSPNETVHKADLNAMLEMYKRLMEKL